MEIIFDRKRIGMTERMATNSSSILCIAEALTYKRGRAMYFMEMYRLQEVTGRNETQDNTKLLTAVSYQTGRIDAINFVSGKVNRENRPFNYAEVIEDVCEFIEAANRRIAMIKNRPETVERSVVIAGESGIADCSREILAELFGHVDFVE